MTNATIVDEMQAIQAQLNDDNIALDEKLNLIDQMVELKTQAAAAKANSSTNNMNIADDPALDLMCGDACQ